MSELNPYQRIAPVPTIDVYTIARLYDVTDAAQFHALKKILGSGTGEKSRRQEIREAIQALERSLALDKEMEPKP